MWLLETNTWNAIAAAKKKGISPSADVLSQMESKMFAADSTGDNRLLTVAGSNAEIAVKGVLTNTPDFFAMMFGGGNATYPEIISALAVAEQNPEVDSITLAVDSPGGTVAGLFETIDAMSNTSKPIKAKVSGMAASAAFALASQADSIVATNKAALIGSVGVVQNFAVSDEVVSITSTDAPKKRPDVTTEEGVAVVRESLDAMHLLFVEALADGRGTTVNKVNADFGQGATLLAEEAMANGMIDDILSITNTTANIGGKKEETFSMDLNTLRAQHPDVYAAAVGEGVTQERDRVTAHVIMGEQSGDMSTASAAIKDGSGMTATLQATYMTAGMNRADIDARDKDSVDATAGDNATPVEATKTLADKVAAATLEKMGLGAQDNG